MSFFNKLFGRNTPAQQQKTGQPIGPKVSPTNHPSQDPNMIRVYDSYGRDLFLEQLLAVRCASLEGVGKNFLSGEREIIDGNIQLCLNHAKYLITRILLLQTMKAMKKVRPELVEEYRDRLQLLHREHPLDHPAQATCDRLLEELLA